LVKVFPRISTFPSASKPYKYLILFKDSGMTASILLLFNSIVWRFSSLPKAFGKLVIELLFKTLFT